MNLQTQNPLFKLRTLQKRKKLSQKFWKIPRKGDQHHNIKKLCKVLCLVLESWHGKYFEEEIIVSRSFIHWAKFVKRRLNIEIYCKHDAFHTH